MKKMPCLFVRDFAGRDFTIREQVTPGCEWVLAGEGVASVKWDGSSCMVRAGQLFKRYDAKQGKTPPEGFEPCQPEPDPVTTHWPGWVPLHKHDKWHAAAHDPALPDGTYELCGPHFQTNPHGFSSDRLIPHGADVLDAPRTFDGLKTFLAETPIEGIVFAHPDGRRAKIRRDDFGFDWPVKE